VVDQIVDAGVYLLAGLVLGHSFTVLLWDRDQRKARKQAAHDAQVSWEAIDGLLNYRRPADD
jgi:hypothetical protein